jgi:hypothetical protein
MATAQKWGKKGLAVKRLKTVQIHVLPYKTKPTKTVQIHVLPYKTKPTKTVEVSVRMMICRATGRH